MRSSWFGGGVRAYWNALDILVAVVGIDRWNSRQASKAQKGRKPRKQHYEAVMGNELERIAGTNDRNSR
jgi:hypothetical protein